MFTKQASERELRYISFGPNESPSLVAPLRVPHRCGNLATRTFISPAMTIQFNGINFRGFHTGRNLWAFKRATLFRFLQAAFAKNPFPTERLSGELITKISLERDRRGGGLEGQDLTVGCMRYD